MANFFMHLCRLFLGIVFLGGGTNGYFFIFGLEPFIAMSPDAMVLFEFKYLLVVVKSLEVISGILLLSNRFVPLAISILSPIVVNILLLHVFLDHSLLLLAMLLAIALGYLLFFYRKNFMGLLERKYDPL